jgi:fibronectin type 3 domain-containing protein
VNPNQTVTLNVQFDPTAAGTANGTLTIISTSLTAPFTTISLSGTGVVVVNYQVNLAWDAPANSPDPVAGYYVFRSLSSVSEYEALNSTAVTQTSYADANVQDGQTYNYYVVSVDASGVESAPSTAASATIP